MKKITLGILFLSLINLSYSQSKSEEECTSPEEDFLELNSISKCDVGNKNEKNANSKNELRISYRKIRKKAVVKKIIKNKDAALSIAANELNKSIDNSYLIAIKKEKLKNLNVQNLLFNVAEKVPVFPKCINNNEEKKCFNEQMHKHFSKNFNPERVFDEPTKEKIFIQFVINLEGNIEDIQIKSKRKNKLLTKEIKRITTLLPKLYPGSHQGIPVNITYGFPISLNVE